MLKGDLVWHRQRKAMPAEAIPLRAGKVQEEEIIREKRQILAMRRANLWMWQSEMKLF